MGGSARPAIVTSVSLRWCALFYTIVLCGHHHLLRDGVDPTDCFDSRLLGSLSVSFGSTSRYQGRPEGRVRGDWGHVVHFLCARFGVKMACASFLGIRTREYRVVLLTSTDFSDIDSLDVPWWTRVRQDFVRARQNFVLAPAPPFSPPHHRVLG